MTTWTKRRFDVDIDPVTEAMLLIGSKEGLAHLAWAYIDPGDMSLCPDPAYTVYKVNTLMAGGEVVTMPLREENGFLPDLSAIPSEVARRAKLLWLNYPNNPTGASAPLSFYEEAVRFAREYDLLLVNDAAYADVYYDRANPPASVLQVAGAKDVAVELHSPEQDVQHDRLAHRVRHRQPGCYRRHQQTEIQFGQQAVPGDLDGRGLRAA